ncbi:MAG: phosphoribosylaminoimidazolesuccinocarboxamide synthase [Rhodospirillales bacterium]|nr:phosphoribosylaminoimidazolesuccinocarboxamide synthase [Rhodospirillales bacterium]
MPSPELSALIAARLSDVITDAAFDDLPSPVRGKVRDAYDLPDGRRLLVATDRQSAFDQVLAAVPFKGQVLTATTQFWFRATADVAPNHLIDVPDPNVMVVRRLDMLPVEVVVRDYLTGTTATSIWPRYAAGDRRMYGLTLPDGLSRNEKLPETILTPTTKGAAGAHDEPIGPRDIIDRGLMTAADWDQVSALAMALFARGRAIAAERGLILVDTKYEFGRDSDGRILIADEIHTPDSSRYWRAASYGERFAAGDDPETLDKDFLRRWIAARCDPYRQPIPEIPAQTLVEFAARYVELYETVTGETFMPPSPDSPVRKRLHRCLKRFF